MIILKGGDYNGLFKEAKERLLDVIYNRNNWYEEKLQKEISRDREAHGKKPLKEKDRNDPPSGGGSDNNTKEEEITEGIKTQKCSTSDPESGWFRKGEHKHVFAYAVDTACDKHGRILGYSIHPGNEHDSRTFKTLYDKIKIYSPAMIIADGESGGHQAYTWQ